MSEFEGLSDSDWLDISSNRSSDDDDSDGEHFFQLPSRRSSASLGSSAGDPDTNAGWEGLVTNDIAAEESPFDTCRPLTTSDGTETIRPGHLISLDQIPNIDAESPSDDERVRDGLNQSMISTLGGSRSSSAGRSSTRGSLRDLRLSFPDPLSSSREDFRVAKATERTQSLNSSFEDVAPVTEAAFPAEDTAPPAEINDPGASPMPVVHDDKQKARCDCFLKQTHNFEIFVYGSRSDAGQSFVDQLISKAVAGGWGSEVLWSERSAPNIRVVHIGSPSVGSKCITIHDVVDRATLAPLTPKADVLSLAIVFLPFSTAVPLTKHTLYLPVLPPSCQDSVETIKVDRQANASWRALAVGDESIVRLNSVSSPATSFRVEDISLLAPISAKRAFSDVLRRAHGPKYKLAKAHSHTYSSLTPAAAITGILALMIGGFALCTSNGPSALPVTVKSTKTSSETVTMSVTMMANQTNSLSTRMSTHLAIVPSALKDFAFAVFPPTSPSTPTAVAPSAWGSLTMPNCEDLTWQSAAPATKAMTVRPSTSLSLSSMFSPSQVTVPPTLSTYLPETIGRVVAETTEEVRVNVHDLVHALDGLMDSVHRQTSIMTRQSRDRARLLSERLQRQTTEVAKRSTVAKDMIHDGARVLTDRLQRQGSELSQQSKGASEAVAKKVVQRNERARRRAKEIRGVGEYLVAHTRETIQERVVHARSRAVAIRSNMVNSAWSAYVEAHERFALDVMGDKENLPQHKDLPKRAPRLKDKRLHSF